MSCNRVVISSGHGLYVRGASGYLDEVDEARAVVELAAQDMRMLGIDAATFHDDVSTTQNENLERIVAAHNAQNRDLDISVHFNCYEQTDKRMGTEVLYLSQGELAGEMSAAIAAHGFIDRGPKERSDLYFLNCTDKPAILIEVCFVDSSADASIYEAKFHDICASIALVLSDRAPVPPPPEASFRTAGRMSYFGGPGDMGVAPDEGLALIGSIESSPQLFLPFQPEGTTGLARRLNPCVHYLACRWDYNVTPKASLINRVALVTAKKTGLSLMAFPADWGPHEDTGRVADLSPALMINLGIATDDEVSVVFPHAHSIDSRA
jgi:N-acetylmuramoyl-L-alanine amidase